MLTIHISTEFTTILKVLVLPRGVKNKTEGYPNYKNTRVKKSEQEGVEEEVWPPQYLYIYYSNSFIWSKR